MKEQEKPETTQSESAPPTIRPFTTFIVKIASRCNLNCSYCFVYNKGDTQWQRQPSFMSDDTFRTACESAVQNCRDGGLDSFDLVFHGGEPLLVGARRLETYCRIARKVFAEAGVRLSLGMQSNGLLFDESIGDICLNHKVAIGVSLDGPPSINDKHRLDTLGRGSSARLEPKLKLLSSDRYRSIFGGFLTVVDPNTDPIEVFSYLAKFKPHEVDFLLPYDNWDRRPPAKGKAEETPYGEWFIRLFDHWCTLTAPPPIRCFHSYIAELLGRPSRVESIGLRAVTLAVIEADGSIEAVDSLKACFDGATKLGVNIKDNQLKKAASHLSVQARVGAGRAPRDSNDQKRRRGCAGGESFEG